MSDPRRPAARPAPSSVPGAPGPEPSPMPHPWAAIVARYAPAGPAPVAEDVTVTVFWWRHRSGVQPVLLVRRTRRD